MANDTLARIQDMLVAKLSPFFGTVHFLQARWNLRGGGRKRAKKKKFAFEGGEERHPKNRGTGGRVMENIFFGNDIMF